MYQNLVHLFNDYGYVFYLLIILLTIVEGPIISVFLGGMLSTGLLSFPLVYASVMLGDIIGDTLLYNLGYIYGEKIIDKAPDHWLTKKVIKNIGKEKFKEKVEIFKEKFHKSKNKILFFSKVTNGFGLSFFVLLTAGIVRVPFFSFLFTNVLAQFVWSGVLILLGYESIDLFNKINFVAGKMFYVALICIILFLVYFFYIKKKK